MAHERLQVWKHDCIKHGMVDANGEGPCDPPCEEPWQVDAPYPHGETFATYEQATEYTRNLLATGGTHESTGSDVTHGTA